MKRNMKMTITALSAMLIMIITVTIISFTMANNNEENGDLTEQANLIAASVSSQTLIDHIIENSHLDPAVVEDADPIYKIVEIGSSATPSTLKDFVENGGFENYVINGNKTIEELMNADSISYTYYAASEITNDSTDKLSVVSNADFIYVSNDPDSKYSKTNDLCEELYNILHTYSSGSYKPLVIDSPTKTDQQAGGGAATETMTTLASDVFATLGTSYYTAGWDEAISVDDYLSHRNGSLYLGINGNKKIANWTTIANPTPGEAELYVSKILVISPSGNTKTMANGILTGAVPMATPATATDIKPEANLYAISTNADTAADSTLYKNGYNARYARPDVVALESIALGDIGSYNLDDYDMVIIESDNAGVRISDEVYLQFAAAMYAGNNIVYNSKMATSSSGGDVDVPTDFQETNYKELFYGVATVQEVTRYENVMVSSKKEMGIITGSGSAATCKVIADLINSSAFRGIGGASSSSSKFTVLEIQPCYPIDLAVAEEVGKITPRTGKYTNKFGHANYYTIPSEVVNGKTKEEIPENTEYYAWELSKAKIASAFGLSVNQIELVQMSTEELAANKVNVLGNYDLIYVGGNTTALKNISEYMMPLNGWGSFLSPNVTLENQKKLPYYAMYSHTGSMLKVDLGPMGETGGIVRSGTPVANVVLNGSVKDSFTVLNGNDITYNKLQELIEYVKVGMPIVFSDDVSAAYDIVKADGYLQNSIDPTSNMYKLMQFCDAVDQMNQSEGKPSNTLWNFDKDATIYVDNNGGDFGATLTGFVSVFAGPGDICLQTGDLVDGDVDKLQALLSNSNTRPKLALTSAPALYNQYDESTKLASGKLNFRYKITGTANYTVRLYIDDDGNSLFSSEEEMAIGGNKELTCTLSDSFYGPVYWMIEVEDNATGMTSSTSGLSYIKNNNDEKQLVRILQIMPGGEVKNSWDKIAGEGAEGHNTLYMCPICQQSYKKLTYNPRSNSGAYNSYNAMYGGNYIEDANGMGPNNHYLGKHEHQFGIVTYDSNLTMKSKGEVVTGYDDWDRNLADEVADLYDFDLDIMIRGEFEAMSRDVQAQYDFSKISDQDKKDRIAAFVIDSNDPYYTEYSKLEDDQLDEKLKIITLKEFEQQSSKYWQLYQYMSTVDSSVSSDSMLDETGAEITKTTLAAEKDFVEALEYIRANTGDAVLKTDLDHVLNEKRYFDYFSMNTGTIYYDQVSVDFFGNKDYVYNLYAEYAKVKDKEIEYKNLYKLYDRYAHPDNWILGCYDTVIIGPSEDFAGDDITDAQALADLKDYVDNDGNTILFHDSLTKFADNGSSKLTANLRESFGMDRYHMTLDESKASDQTYYMPYTTPDSEKYYMTNLSTIEDDSKYTSWINDMRSAVQGFSNFYLSSVAYTDAINYAGNAGNYNQHIMPYKYAEFSWTIASYWYSAASFNEKDNNKFGTNRASQNNTGIITTFPFGLSSQLNISGTHSQSYAIDIEDEDMTVWYSLAGGTNSKDGSSLHAASPKDGMDSYFIYTYGNVNYCGAGHSKVTGMGKDNNDERRLYINIICNSVRNSVKQPMIYVYDHEKETYGDVIKRDISGEYYTKVDEMDGYPEFSFKAVTDQESSLVNVKIYYDLDYSLENQLNDYTADKNHVLIADWSAADVSSGVRKDVSKYLPSLKTLLDDAGNPVMDTYVDATGAEVTTKATTLKLLPKYFEPYNSEYTYIVIAATDSSGNTVYQRIKVMMKDFLFNLT